MFRTGDERKRRGKSVGIGKSSQLVATKVVLTMGDGTGTGKVGSRLPEGVVAGVERSRGDEG